MVERAGAVTRATTATAELAALYAGDDRPAPAGRPWVVINMVASVDGATEVGGVTRSLGSPTDRAVFSLLREVADAVLVGASTVRAERYGPVRLDSEARARRASRGRPPVPPVAVVTRSVDLDWAGPLFAGSEPPPILLAPETTDPPALETASRHADVVACGRGDVDLSAAVAGLRDRGVGIVLCEGGPTLSSELASLGLVDEICLTISPALAVGAVRRGLLEPSPGDGQLRPLTLLHAVEEAGYLYLRYRTG